jgi:ADP-ribose pyrophosphatase YjhB (NUDIX family)
MNFCPSCGQPTTRQVPAGDNQLRVVCTVCHAIHYQNPRIVAGCIVECQGKILLCRRAIEPRRGYWTNPAGFMEIGESLLDAAARETREEALAEVSMGSMLSVVNVLPRAQVHIFFRAMLPEPRFGAGAESLEVQLFDPADLPWNELAFRSGTFSLQCFLADRSAGREELHYLDIP